ncbi:hypothetical protein [Rhizobium leguminosarum]|uniref:hypothetical protein n=1 Tax=Rhizobium leguminosarum TaxID=384 RepID=UPI003F957F63
MADPAVQTQLLGVLGAFTTSSFALTFAFGAGVIAIYAGKRLGELIVPPKGDEYDFIKMITLPMMVGRGLFAKSYICYVLILEFIYLFLCTSRPLVAVISSNQLTGFDDYSWPLAAALLVVGVLPTVPFVAQIEVSLRRFAHNLADIPEDFYNRIAAISTADLEQLARGVPSYDEHLERFWITHNSLIILGFEATQAEKIARKALAVTVFEDWTVEGREYWSPNEYQRYTDIFDLLKPKSITLINDHRSLLRETAKSAIVRQVLAGNPDFKINSHQTAQAKSQIASYADQLLTQIGGIGPAPAGFALTVADRDAFDALKEAWEKKYLELDTHARRLIALFSIMARNDVRLLREIDRYENTKDKRSYFLATINDPVRLKVIKDLRNESSEAQPWYNSMIVSSAAVFMFCMAGIFVFQFSLELLGAVTPASQNWFEQLKSVLFSSINTSLEFSTSFLFSGLAALYIRREKMKDQTWLEYYGLNTLPLSSYIGVALLASAAAFLPAVVNYVVYFIANHPAEFANQNPVTLLRTLIERFIFSLLWGGVAIVLCIISDVVSEHGSVDRNKVLSCIAVSIAVSASIILIGTSFTPLDTPFWHRLFGIVISGTVGVWVFERNIRARTSSNFSGNRDTPPAPPEDHDPNEVAGIGAEV